MAVNKKKEILSKETESRLLKKDIMKRYKSINIETMNYIERASKKIIESRIIKISDSSENYIECIEITGVNIGQQKLILTLQNYYTKDKKFVVIPFSLLIKNKPTNKNEEF